MTFWLTVAGMVAVTFGSRLAGLSLHRPLPDAALRFLHFVPIAVFAALVAPSVEGGSGEGGIRVVSAALAGVVAWRTGSLWLVIAVGMTAFWLLRVPF